MQTTTSIISGGGDGDFLTVRHLRAGGTHREIGRALAAAAEAAHGSAARPQRSADPRVESARRRWFDMHHPAQAGRLRGVADHFGLDPSDPGVALDWLGTYELPAGCSVAFYPGEGTKDGHGLLSRNFDFPTATLTQMLGLPADAGRATARRRSLGGRAPPRRRLRVGRRSASWTSWAPWTASTRPA